LGFFILLEREEMSESPSWVPEEFEYIRNAKVKKIVDGDTIDLLIDLGYRMKMRDRFRILDLDTWEKYGKAKDDPEREKGIVATEFAKNLLPVDTRVIVRTHKDKKGKYGRWLADIFIPGVGNFADVMKAAGHDKRIDEDGNPRT
jgi:micrococcal nuclease